MRVHKVPGVCSMLSISNNPYGITKTEFLELLYNAIKEHNEEVRNKEIRYSADLIYLSSIKSVMLITNNGRFSYSFMKNTGKYKGNTGGYARIKLMKFPKGLNYTFKKECIGELVKI